VVLTFFVLCFFATWLIECVVRIRFACVTVSVLLPSVFTMVRVPPLVVIVFDPARFVLVCTCGLPCAKTGSATSAALQMKALSFIPILLTPNSYFKTRA
jgi:hypothetical protein